MATLESLRLAAFDHSRAIEDMSGEDVLKELLYLEAGHADEQSPRGVKLGLPPELEARRFGLQNHIMECVESKRAETA